MKRPLLVHFIQRFLYHQGPFSRLAVANSYRPPCFYKWKVLHSCTFSSTHCTVVRQILYVISYGLYLGVAAKIHFGFSGIDKYHPFLWWTFNIKCKRTYFHRDWPRNDWLLSLNHRPCDRLYETLVVLAGAFYFQCFCARARTAMGHF